MFPSRDFLRQRLLVGNAAVKTLTREDTEFNLRHIEPTTVLGGVVKLQAVENPASFRGWKSFVKGGFDRGVEIVLHDPHGNGIGEHVIDEILHLMSIIETGALICNAHVPPPLERGKAHKQIRCAIGGRSELNPDRGDCLP